MAITIKRVGESAKVADFLRVPHITQGHDPYWVASLSFECGPLADGEAPRLNPKRNPWFQHGEAVLWVAERDGKLAGRISAQIDHNHLKLYNDATGFFGFFECIDDQGVADALFDAAFVWLREKGMRRCVGPFSFNINDESGLLIDGFNCPPRLAMGHAQPYYQKLVETAGFAKAVDMRAYLTPMDTALPYKQLKWLKRSLQRNPKLKVRALDPKRYDEDFAAIIDIFRAGWTENWGSIPMTDAEAKHLAEEVKLILVPELVSIATIDDRPVAMCLALPDRNEMIHDLKGKLSLVNALKLLWRLLTLKSYISGTRVILMGVLPEFKNKPMGSQLALLTVGAVREASLKLRMPVCEMSWVLETNTQTCHSIEDIGGRVYKTYRMFERPLDGRASPRAENAT
ncbi:MAG: GNAT family N-acetyltransferase [Rhodospirillaceae bacterium]|nr:GNAT family N-acetyltransferase [Rhodospirillaceae bacterium]